MKTNQEIYQAFIDKINTAYGGTYQISYEGYTLTPPTSGIWLELKHFPNTGVDQSLSSTTVLAQGMFQINVVDRKEKGIMHLQSLAQTIANLFPKSAQITGTARVSRMPYQGSPLAGDDRVTIGLTIPYSE